MTTGKSPEFSRLICIPDIGLGEANIEISANAKECEALANRYSLKNIHYLTATLNFSKSNRNKILLLNAHYVTEITQMCVVTLEPLTNIINGEFSSHLAKKAQHSKNKNFIFDVDDLDQTEIMDDGYFDAGELVSEFLSLEINPFPRSNAAEFEMETFFNSKYHFQKNNPFEKLKKLQTKEK